MATNAEAQSTSVTATAASGSQVGGAAVGGRGRRACASRANTTDVDDAASQRLSDVVATIAATMLPWTLLEKAQARSRRHCLTGLGDGQWTTPTPCDGWSVADVARHLVTAERAFTIALGGTAYDLAAIDAEVRTIATADLATAYAAAAAGLRAALAAAPPDVPVPSPLGPVPPGVVAEIRVLEAVVHGWDLGQALGAPPDLGSDDDLLPLVDAADRLRAGLEVARPGSTALGTPVEAGRGASALERVVARLGRAV